MYKVFDDYAEGYHVGLCAAIASFWSGTGFECGGDETQEFVSYGTGCKVFNGGSSIVDCGNALYDCTLGVAEP